MLKENCTLFLSSFFSRKRLENLNLGPFNSLGSRHTPIIQVEQISFRQNALDFERFNQMTETKLNKTIKIEHNENYMNITQ